MKMLQLMMRIALVLSFFAVNPASAEVSPEGEFIMSCTYGVLTGTLVGAALLAFEDKPGENLQQVARGASIGLYMGIGLGYYTAYILPKQLQKEEDSQLDNVSQAPKFEMPRFMIFPLLASGQDLGVGAIWQVAHF